MLVNTKAKVGVFSIAPVSYTHLEYCQRSCFCIYKNTVCKLAYGQRSGKRMVQKHCFL